MPKGYAAGAICKSAFIAGFTEITRQVRKGIVVFL